MQSHGKEILQYTTRNGKVPFEEWLRGLRDEKGKAAVRARIARARLGNLGSLRSIGGGVFEMKISVGPGYRIYLGQLGKQSILFLCAGDKSTQTKDIQQAHLYWADYKRGSS